MRLVGEQPLTIGSKQIEELLETVVSLRSVKEARLFLRDLLTESELIEFGKRWKAARMLSAAVPYSQIVSETGLSSTTVARISHWLKEGTGGYRMMIERDHHRHHQHRA